MSFALTTPPIPTKAPWVRRAAFPLVSLAFFGAQSLIALTLWREWLWASATLAVLASHLMHGILIGFHEAAHGLLRKNRLLNELDGVLIGMFSLTSFTLFRVVHQTHHAYLATEKDEEMWPLVKRSTPRHLRLLWACLELGAGLLFSPIIFLRSFLRRGSPIRNKRVRRRIWWELGLTVAFWTCALSAVAVFGLWPYFLWMYLAPAILAANLQSLRKYIEHVGLTGKSIKGLTRSIVASDWIGRLVALSLLHEPFHGVHHQRVGLPHSLLPTHAADLHPASPEEQPVFRSYREAFLNLFHTLRDPRVGPQWQQGEV